MKDEKGLIAQRGKGRISQPEGTSGAQMGVRKVSVRQIEEEDCRGGSGPGNVVYFFFFLHNVYYTRKMLNKRWVSEIAQSCPTLCDLMDCMPPGSSVHGILQVRILEWVAIPLARGSSQPRD